MLKAFLLFVLATVSVAQDVRGVVLPARLDSLLLACVDHIMLDEYDAAERTAIAASRAYPDHPAGPVMWAAVLHQRAEERVDIDVDPRVDYLSAVEAMRENFSQTTAEGRMALAFLSSARGIDAVVSSRRGVWLRAVERAVACASLGEDVLAADSSIADAGLGVGNYYYRKSRSVELLTWLPFVADSREEGIDLLRHCATSGRYQRYAAINSLAWILRDAGVLDEALTWADRGLADYPNNRALLRNRGSIRAAAGDEAGAYRSWSAVADAIDPSDGGCEWTMLEARTAAASHALKAGMTAEARSQVLQCDDLERTLAGTVLDQRRENILRTLTSVREELGGSPQHSSNR